MKPLYKYSLLEFLDKLNYIDTYKKFEEYILKLCSFTKCRANPNIKMGYESCYLFIALQSYFGLDKFLEFGTGRGTTSFLMASMSGIKQVTTIDIIPFEQTQLTWCDYKRCVMSVSEIHNRCVEALGKPNVSIERFTEDSVNLKSYRIKTGPFDFVYIDGSHDYEPVKNDFKLAKELLADDAIVIFDDYNPQYGVYRAVNELMVDEDYILVSVNGHLYGENKESLDCGHIIWAKGKYKELLYA